MRGLSLTLLALWTSSAALAQYEGEWRAGPRQVRHEVRSWGPDCGPRPPASFSRPGGSVQITQSGDHLRFQGAVRGATNRCWSDKPGIRRVSVSFQGGTWTIRCQTPEGDAQPERGRYVFRASGDTIRFEEETSWDWRLRNSRCLATRRATQTLTKVSAAAPAEPPTREPRCESPGPPARIRLRPTERTIAPGERVCVRAQVVDAAGCPLSSRRVALELEAPPGVSAGTFDGRCFTAGERAAEAEGLFRVVARSGEMRASAEIEVRSEDLSDLTARREREGRRRDDGLRAEAEEAAGVSAHAVRDGGWLLWGGALAVLALLAAFASVILRVRRRRRASERPAAGAVAPERSPDPSLSSAPSPALSAPPAPQAPVGATARPPVRVCPVCGREDESGDAFCPNDGSPLLDPSDPETRARGMICPACRRGYGPREDTCRHDGETLVPYALFVAQQKRAELEVRKVCPSCGATYEAAMTFCGKDGTPLETLN